MVMKHKSKRDRHVQCAAKVDKSCITRNSANEEHMNKPGFTGFTGLGAIH